MGHEEHGLTHGGMASRTVAGVEVQPLVRGRMRGSGESTADTTECVATANGAKRMSPTCAKELGAVAVRK